jgi:hypothetical protein
VPALRTGQPRFNACPTDPADTIVEHEGKHERVEASCLDLLVCERHHSVFHEDKWWIVYCKDAVTTRRPAGLIRVR